MKQTYDIFTQDGELYERIFVTGEDEAECEDGLNAYLLKKQDCYALASDDGDPEDEEEDEEDPAAAAAWLQELNSYYSATRL